VAFIFSAAFCRRFAVSARGFPEEAGISAPDRLGHARKVVLPGDGLDPAGSIAQEGVGRRLGPVLSGSPLLFLFCQTDVFLYIKQFQPWLNFLN
jgi:hypothetical protein